jgi:hypothetical protein
MRRALLVALVALVAIQFVPVPRSNPPVETEVPAPAPVREILKRACYDCHSHETRWPWYSRVAPVSWLVAHDVDEAREHVDFSAWNRYDPPKRAKQLEEIWEEVEEGEMPLWFYVLLHPEARLSDEDRAVLRRWTQSGEAG